MIDPTILDIARNVGFSVNLDPGTGYYVIQGRDEHLHKFATSIRANAIMDMMVLDAEKMGLYNDNYNPKAGEV